MIILGVTGPIGHGKTSLAEAFLRLVPGAQHTEASILIGRVADALNIFYAKYHPTNKDIPAINAWLSHLPSILKEVVHFPDTIQPIQISDGYDLAADLDFQKLSEYLQLLEEKPGLAAQTITVENKEQYRSILQWLGGYITTHIHPTLWFDELLREGNRAEKESCPLFLIGGVRFPSNAEVIKKAGGLIVDIERPSVAELDMQDSTEANRRAISVDTVIINDANLAALDTVVQRMWRDLQHNTLQKEYRASSKSTAPAAQG